MREQIGNCGLAVNTNAKKETCSDGANKIRMEASPETSRFTSKPNHNANVK